MNRVLLVIAVMTFVVHSAQHPYASTQPLTKPTLFAPGIVTTADDESHPTFSADGHTLYFLRNTPNFAHWTVMISQWRNGRWLEPEEVERVAIDRKSTRLNSSHTVISYAVFCLKKKNQIH